MVYGFQKKLQQQKRIEKMMNETNSYRIFSGQTL